MNDESGDSQHGPYTLEDDSSGRGLMPDEMRSDMSDSGKYLNFDWGDRSLRLLASRNLESTPLEMQECGKGSFSDLQQFVGRETRARSETFSRNVDFVQREADLFAQRRSTTFLRNIDFAQHQAEELARSGGAALDENVNSALELAKPSVGSLADSIDSVQEQMEAATRDLGESISRQIDYAQEQAEMFTSFLASSVFGAPTIVEDEPLQEEPEPAIESPERSSSVKEFLDARVDTFTKNIEFSTRQVEGVLWTNQPQPAFFPQ